MDTRITDTKEYKNALEKARNMYPDNPNMQIGALRDQKVSEKIKMVGMLELGREICNSEKAKNAEISIRHMEYALATFYNFADSILYDAKEDELWKTNFDIDNLLAGVDIVITNEQ